MKTVQESAASAIPAGAGPEPFCPSTKLNVWCSWWALQDLNLGPMDYESSEILRNEMHHRASVGEYTSGLLCYMQHDARSGSETKNQVPPVVPPARYTNPPEPQAYSAVMPASWDTLRTALLAGGFHEAEFWQIDCPAHGDFRLAIAELDHPPCCPKCQRRCSPVFLGVGFTLRALPFVELTAAPLCEVLERDLNRSEVTTATPEHSVHKAHRGLSVTIDDHQSSRATISGARFLAPGAKEAHGQIRGPTE